MIHRSLSKLLLRGEDRRSPKITSGFSWKTNYTPQKAWKERVFRGRSAMGGLFIPKRTFIEKGWGAASTWTGVFTAGSARANSQVS